jgi:hypothetical protein
MIEVERLETNKAGEIPTDLNWIYLLRPKEDVDACLSRIVQIVKLIAVQTPGHWPSMDEWRTLLPDWFVKSFVPFSKEEAERLIATTPRERWNEIPWLFEAWLEAIQARGWQWWSSGVDEEGIQICLQITEWPASLEAFERIISASGAEFISKTSLDGN